MTRTTSSETRRERALAALYRQSLRLLPARFRRPWAEEMRALFAQRLRDARHRDALALAVLTSREIGSVVVTAFRTHLEQVAGRAQRACERQNGRDMCSMDPAPAHISADSRRLKVAWIGALACHFVLFAVVLPQPARTDGLPPAREVVRLRLLPPPPPKAPVAEVKTAPINPVPIPDPDPESPEPLYVARVERTHELQTRPEASFSVAPPVDAPEPPTARLRAGAGVDLPALIHRVDPDYPELAIRARMECTVILEAVIGKQGDIADLRVLRGCGLGLDQAALSAVSEWRYTPTAIDGRPVEIVAVVTVNFRLR